MRKRILGKLDEISKNYDVRILYACESGSRAWGFASKNSDYDVRFIYMRKPQWYLSIDLDKKPDVIELPIVDELDINGWDLRKALQLFQKSNPPLFEWLSSPIIYNEVVTDPALLSSINTLLARKASADELGLGPRYPVLSRFLESQLERMSEQGFEKQIQRCPVESLNRLFLETVNRCNPEKGMP